jgi:serine/threonine-protein kinase
LYWGVDDQDQYLVSAREAIDQGRIIDPELPELKIAEGYYFYWGHLDYKSALKILEPVLAVYPGDFELLELLAWVNRRYGKFDTALEFMFKALDVAPRDHRVLFGVGETYAAMRRFDEAQDYLNKLSEVAPASPRTAQLRGSILSGRGADYEGAARNFQLASMDLRFLEMDVWMSYVLAGNLESALAEVSSPADATDAARRGYFDIRQTLSGMTLLYSGDLEGAKVVLSEAREYLETALKLNPDEYQLHKALCLTNGALGESIATSTSCDDAISTMPKDAYDHYSEVTQIAQGYALGGLQDKALDNLEAALDAPVGPTAGEIAANPAFRSLHEMSRWQGLLRKHGIQQ